ncbi:Predicted arabinose efflux permease, MFS family [Streptomyces sp. TLI_053]|uniref:MFS transporter n=1 Tax=Streptomyces sp. TLI_053 TaxID=1855352 RepID=UPI00087CE065|nr:MFS transporter [Streptomyces sp. TLI_053]SDT82412.1 Predicted arabinose efflux permease, MFS family [Streptomyces sp. TLI_053]
MTSTHHPHPLRLPAFRLLFLGRTISTLGDAVVPAALAIAVTRATGSSSALALVLGCAMVPRLLLLPLGGVVGDRVDPRLVALVTDLVRAVAQIAVGVELLGDRPSLAAVAAAEAVGGIASAFAMPTASPLVAVAVDGPQRLRANALLASAVNGARLGGPALAGLLVLTAGPGWAFLLDGASFLVSAALLTRLKVRRAPAERRSSLRADLVRGWSEVRSRDWYWTSLIGHAVWNGAAAVLLTLGPLIASRRMGGEGVWIAMTQAAAFGVLAGSLLAGRFRPRRPLLVSSLGLALYALPLVALAATAPAPVTVASYALAMTGLGFLNPVWQTVVQQEFPPQVLARVTSYDWLLSLAAAPLGYTLAPLAADAWGSTGPLLVTAALVALACGGAAVVPGVRRIGCRTDADGLTESPAGGPADGRHSSGKGPAATGPQVTGAPPAAEEAAVGAARRDPTIRT